MCFMLVNVCSSSPVHSAVCLRVCVRVFVDFNSFRACITIYIYVCDSHHLRPHFVAAVFFFWLVVLVVVVSR